MQIDPGQICPVQGGALQVGPAQIGIEVRLRLAPRVPGEDPLSELGQIPLPPTSVPGTLVIGEVVSLADRIAQEDPLFYALEKGVPA